MVAEYATRLIQGQESPWATSWKVRGSQRWLEEEGWQRVRKIRLWFPIPTQETATGDPKTPSEEGLEGRRGETKAMTQG